MLISADFLLGVLVSLAGLGGGALTAPVSLLIFGVEPVPLLAPIFGLWL